MLDERSSYVGFGNGYNIAKIFDELFLIDFFRFVLRFGLRFDKNGPLLANDRISQAILGKCPRSRNTRLKNPLNRSKLDNFLNLGPLASVNSSNQNFFDFETLLLGDSVRGMTL